MGPFHQTLGQKIHETKRPQNRVFSELVLLVVKENRALSEVDGCCTHVHLQEGFTAAGLGPAFGSAHARNGRGCRQIYSSTGRP